VTVHITWSDPNGPMTQEEEVRIYRDTAPFDAGSLPTIMATLPADTLTYDDATATPGTSYWYAVGFVKDGRLRLSFVSDVYIQGALFSEVATFGAATVFLTGQSLTGTVFGDTATFGAATITTGPVTIVGTLFEDAATFGAAEVDVDGDPEYMVTVPSGTVGSDLTDFVTPIHLSEMPSSFWTAVRSDGGNVRAYESDGATLIAHDMAFIDTELEVGLLFVRKTLTAAADTEVIVKLLDLSTTKLGPTDTHGRNAVWTDYEVAVVFPEVINRTDGSSPSLAGGPVETQWKQVGEVSLTANQGVAFDGTTYYAVSTASIRRYSSTGTLLTTSTTPVSDMITATGDSTLDHCGAPSIIDGELWVPIQEYPASPYNSQYIGRFALSDLSFIGYLQLTGATRESSGVHYDVTLGRLYVTDYTSAGTGTIPYFDKTTGAYVGDLTLSSAVDEIQGMTELDGKYYINSRGNGVYEVEKDGTVIGLVIPPTYGSDEESVYAYGDVLIFTQATGRVGVYEKVPELQGWSRIHGAPIGFQKSKSTIWTMAVSWYATPSVIQQAIMGVRSISSATDRHSGMYDAPTANGFGLWNTSNGWLYTSPRTFPTAYNKYRAAFAQNDTSARKLSVNGVKNSAGSSSARPTTSADVRYEIGGAAEGADGYGYYQFAWVRHEYMSDDWIDADYESFTSPATFYSITEL